LNENQRGRLDKTPRMGETLRGRLDENLRERLDK